MRLSWIAVVLLGALAACGAPVDERSRVAGVLQDDRRAAPQPTVSAAPSPMLQQEARRSAPVAMTPPAPRPDEPAPAPATQERAVAPTTRPTAPARRVEPEQEEEQPIVAAVDPDRLLGLGRSELADLMGTPMILRNEPPGELWLYKNDACVAHVYLYENGGPDDYVVRYVETRGNGGTISSPVCLAAFAGGAASAVSLNEGN